MLVPSATNKIYDIINEYCHDEIFVTKDQFIELFNEINSIISKNEQLKELSERAFVFDLSKIKEVYGDDKVVLHLKDTKPSSADCTVFRKQGEIVKKSYFKLESGRIVEMITFRDNSQICIGSFTSTPEECCEEGWATYHLSFDEQWKDLVFRCFKETVNKLPDWSCGWNCVQNLIYIRTGMKVTVLEIFHCLMILSLRDSERKLELIKSVKDKASLKSIMEKEVSVFIVMIHNFFSYDPAFSCSSSSESYLLNCRLTSSAGKFCYNIISEAAGNILEKLKEHNFIEHGPLLCASGRTALLLFSNDIGQPIMIDPHNLKRVSNFVSIRSIKEFRSLKEYFTIDACEVSGQRRLYGHCYHVNGLQRDVDLKPLQAIIKDSRKKGILTLEMVSEQIIALKKFLEKDFDETFNLKLASLEGL